MTVLVVAAHPDDEILGVGGTLAAHASAGETVNVLICAEGSTSRDEGSRDEVETLQEAARAAAKALGTNPPQFLGLPDNRLDRLDLLDVTKQIAAVVETCAPRLVYTHHGGDLNIDHRIVHQAVVTACRPLPGSSVGEILAFETASSTEWATTAIGEVFKPTAFKDISGTWNAKRKALEAYAAEMRPFPHARSIEAVEALAKLRGSQASMPMAEGFQVLLSLR
ncbi:MAG: PIG-L deacetylase family protein [Magnetovibrionaceae bacterium]